jgi:hypothetical protein
VSEQTDDRPPGPSVSTAPAHSRWRALPSHLGRARTSTVVLAVLFLVIGALYLNVRPAQVATTTTGGGGGVQQPAEPTTTVAPTTAEPTTTAPAQTTTEQPTSTESTSAGSPASSTPSDTTTTTRSPTSTGLPEPVPTTSAPSG